MSGFTLKEIYPDKVIMVRGEDTMVVDLLDSSNKKTRGSKPPLKRPMSPSARAPTKQKVLGRDVLMPPLPAEVSPQ